MHMNALFKETQHRFQVLLGARVQLVNQVCLVQQEIEDQMELLDSLAPLVEQVLLLKISSFNSFYPFNSREKAL